MWVKTGCLAGLRIRVELARIRIRPSRKTRIPVWAWIQPSIKTIPDPTLEKQHGIGSNLIHTYFSFLYRSQYD